MLNLFGNTRMEDTEEISILSGVSVQAEGLCIAQAFENGNEVGKLSSGTADVFLGFSYGQVYTPITKSIVVEAVVPATSPYTVTLPQTPILGQLMITNGTTEQTLGTPATDPNEYSIVDKVVTFHSGQASATMTFTLRYSPSVMELNTGDFLQITTMSASDVIGSIGVIKRGVIFTDQFDAGDTFVGGAQVSMGIGGIVVAGNANAIPNAFVSHVPTIENPFLGIRIR